MLKCPSCGRTGGPFRLRHQIQADGQTLRGWSCPCGNAFHAVAGAERTATPQPVYTGFTVEWNGRSMPIRLLRISRHETLWSMGPWTLSVAGPPSGPGTRVVTLWASDDKALCEWRLEPGWGASEIARRVRGKELPPELDPDYMSRVLIRVLA